MTDMIAKGIMMNKVQKVAYYRRLSARHKFELLFFDPQGLNWKQKSVFGLRLKDGRWQEGCYSFPQAIYNRCYPKSAAVVNKLREAAPFPKIFNTQTQLDKWDVYQWLVKGEAAEHLPLTYQYTEETLGDLIAEHREIIFKPRRGYGGAMVYLLSRAFENVFLLRSHLGFPLPVIRNRFCLPFLLGLAPKERFIAQKYIRTPSTGGTKWDTRILMQKNRRGEWEMAGRLSRIAKAGALLTNDFVSIVDPQTLIKGALLVQMQAISYVVAHELEHALGSLGEIGVDFLIDIYGKPWILEVNGKPDKTLFWKLKDDKILERVYLNPIDYLCFLAGED